MRVGRSPHHLTQARSVEAEAPTHAHGMTLAADCRRIEWGSRGNAPRIRQGFCQLSPSNASPFERTGPFVSLFGRTLDAPLERSSPLPPTLRSASLRKP